MKRSTWQKNNVEIFSQPSNARFLAPRRMPEQPVFQAFPPNNDNDTFAELIVVIGCTCVLLVVATLVFVKVLS